MYFQGVLWMPLLQGQLILKLIIYPKMLLTYANTEINVCKSIFPSTRIHSDSPCFASYSLSILHCFYVFTRIYLLLAANNCHLFLSSKFFYSLRLSFSPFPGVSPWKEEKYAWLSKYYWDSLYRVTSRTF